MKKRGIVLMAAFVLLVVNIVTVYAKEEENMPLYNTDNWYVSSYPGIAGSDTCSIMREAYDYFDIITSDYYSSGTSNGIQVTSDGSNDILYITSTGTKKMFFKTNVGSGESRSVSFYAYSSNCRIYGQGYVRGL